MINNNFITLRDNGVQYGPFPKKQYEFLKKAQYINEVEHRTFCIGDFKPELSPESFRQYIFKLGKYIEVERDIYPKFYKIKGIELPTKDRWMTKTDEIIGTNMPSILSKLDRKSLIIKNIKMKFNSNKELYNLYKNTDKIDELDKEIEVKPVRDKELEIIVKMNLETVNIEINGKDKPAVSCMNDLIKITDILGRITEFISFMTCRLMEIPSAGNWLCISYSLGTNGQYLYEEPQFHRTWKDLAAGFMKIFSEYSDDDRAFSNTTTLS